MWHRYLINSLATAQYLIYLLVGAFFFAVMSILGAGWGALPNFSLWFLITPLVLGGYASALAFIVPRTAAIVASLSVLPFFIFGLSRSVRASLFMEGPGTHFVIPSAIVVAVSMFALLWSEGSIWRRSGIFGRVVVALLALIPAAYATRFLALFFWGAVEYFLHRAT